MPDRKDPKSVLDGYYGDAADPYAEYPNPEAARAGSRVGLIEKLLGHLSGLPGGLRGRSSAPSQSPEIGRRTKEPWMDALANTTGSQSIANMVHDLAHGVGAAKQYKPGTQDYTAGSTTASLMNAPVLGGFAATGTRSVPKGALGSSFAEGPKIAPAMRERVIDPHTGTYSAVIEGAHGLDLKSGTPEQFINAVLKKPNVKPEELYWMGLADYAGPGKMVPSQRLKDFVQASGGKGKLTKDDFTKMAEANRVKPEKTVREGTGIDEESQRDQMWDAAHEQADRHEVRPDPEGIVDEMMDIEREPDNSGKWRIVDRSMAQDLDESELAKGHHVIEDGFHSERAAYDAAEKHAEDIAKEQGRFSVYDQDNNRVHGPFDSERRAERAAERANESAVEHAYENLDPSDFGDPNGAEHLEHLGNRPGGEEAGQNYRENVYSVPQQTLTQRGLPEFLRSHYPENGNVFSHALVHDYTDAATNLPGTYLTEGQSDWRKALTKSGVAKSGPELAALEKASNEARLQHQNAQERVYESAPVRQGMDPTDAVKLKHDLWKRFEDSEDFPQGYGLSANRREWLEAHRPDEYQQFKRAQDASQWYDRADSQNEYRRMPSADETGKLQAAREAANDALKEYDQRQAYVSKHTGDVDPNWAEDALSQYQTQRKTYEDLLAQYNPMSPEEAKAHEAQMAALGLRETETRNAYQQGKSGVTPGPWVSEYNKSGWQSDKGAADRWMAKQLLWETANDPSKHWLGWPTPEVIADRWGDKVARGYKQDIPNSMLKQAQLHDPEAKIGEVHIGDFNPATSARYRGPETVRSHSDEPFLPFEQGRGELPTDRERPDMRVYSRPEDIVMGPWGGGTGRIPSASGEIPRPVYHLADENGRRLPASHGFSSRASAEEALTHLQRQFDEQAPNLAKAREENDLTAQPAIKMTDKMRESIKKKGFPLFVNPPTAGGLAGFLQNPSPTTAGSVLDKAYPTEDQQ